VDGNTPQKRKESLEYVTKRLAAKSHGDDFGYYHVRDGEPVIVTFGMDVGVFPFRKMYKGNVNDNKGDEEWFLEPHARYDYSREEQRAEMERGFLGPLKRKWEGERREIEREQNQRFAERRWGQPAVYGGCD
jgi:hypothetical protein